MNYFGLAIIITFGSYVCAQVRNTINIKRLCRFVAFILKNNEVKNEKRILPICIYTFSIFFR